MAFPDSVPRHIPGKFTYTWVSEVGNPERLLRVYISAMAYQRCGMQHSQWKLLAATEPKEVYIDFGSRKFTANFKMKAILAVTLVVVFLATAESAPAARFVFLI